MRSERKRRRRERWEYENALGYDGQPLSDMFDRVTARLAAEDESAKNFAQDSDIRPAPGRHGSASTAAECHGGGES